MSRILSPTLSTFAGGLILVLSSGAAQAGTGGWHNGSWYADGEAVPNTPPAERPLVEQREAARPAPPYRNMRTDYATQPIAMPGREAWLADCRSRVSNQDNGVGGALIGGAVGGIAGNRIAGRHNRVIGTLGGAAVGAVAGSAIDRAEDRGRGRDECEAYLDDYYARYAAEYRSGYPAPGGYVQGYAQPGYTASYAPGYAYSGTQGCCGQVMMVPVQSQPECTETVEYYYEDVPVRSHSTPRRTKIVRDKRVKITSDKRVSIK